MLTLIFISILGVISFEYICRIGYPTAYIRPTNVLHYLALISDNIFYILGYYIGFMTDLVSLFNWIKRIMSNLFNNIFKFLNKIYPYLIDTLHWIYNCIIWLIDTLYWIYNYTTKFFKNFIQNMVRFLNYIMANMNYYIKLTPFYDIFNLMKSGLSLIKSLKGFFIGYKTYFDTISAYLYNLHTSVWKSIGICMATFCGVFWLLSRERDMNNQDVVKLLYFNLSITLSLGMFLISIQFKFT